MKKRITIYNLIATAVLVLTLTGCNDFFEVKPQNVTIEDDFWNEKADVDQMIGGLYTQLQSTDVVKRMMVWGEFRSDNVTAGNDIDKDNSLQKVFKEDIDASNGYTTWTPFYYIINSCNTIIDHAPAVAATDPAFSESELNADIAEASAIRDLRHKYNTNADYKRWNYRLNADVDITPTTAQALSGRCTRCTTSPMGKAISSKASPTRYVHSNLSPIVLLLFMLRFAAFHKFRKSHPNTCRHPCK